MAARTRPRCVCREHFVRELRAHLTFARSRGIPQRFDERFGRLAVHVQVVGDDQARVCFGPPPRGCSFEAAEKSFDHSV